MGALIEQMTTYGWWFSRWQRHPLNDKDVLSSDRDQGLGRINALIDCSETRLNRCPNQVLKLKNARLPEITMISGVERGCLNYPCPKNDLLDYRFDLWRGNWNKTVRLMISFNSLWLICKGFSWITRTLLAKSLHFMLAAFNSCSLLMQVLSSIIDKKISAYRNFLTGRK